MLIVLDHPKIPLHNNPAVKAWDTFMTLSATAKKLGVNFYHYISDRISGAYKMLSMAQVITERAEQLNLGASWDSS